MNSPSSHLARSALPARRRPALQTAHATSLSAVAAATIACAVLAGCATESSSPPPPSSSGAAGGATSVGGDASLQTCAAPVGTVRLQDGQASADTGRNQVASNETIQSVRLLLGSISDALPNNNRASANEGVSLDALRLLIQQSNCLVIVDRGASEAAATDEKNRTRSPNSETRDGSNMGPGQEVAADFVLRSSVLAIGTDQSSSFGLGSLLPKFASGLTGSQSTTTAKVQLVLSDVRAKIQLAVAQGDGSGKNTGLATGVLGRVGAGLGGGTLKTESKTSPATVLLQAFGDAYNKLVPAMRGYQAQMVKGGLGLGGTLNVQGGKADASQVHK